MPQNIDPQAIDMRGSYAPPTAEVGQGGALQSAENDQTSASPDAKPALEENALGSTGSHAG